MVADRDVQDGKRDKDTRSRSNKPSRGQEPHVANALRSAYEETVRENIPSEFLDLLGKLS